MVDVIFSLFIEAQVGRNAPRKEERTLMMMEKPEEEKEILMMDCTIVGCERVTSLTPFEDGLKLKRLK
ncbi:hypothetical protein L1987_12911 [Smallanthus sonchifolius]|uniref:Uncharacterized protein n=1 Tax=Smallanthus sonchifolius TaxID=185202 RepID=A0ACB9JGL8_9ASTR|nr:hypothetical protein L1987_12911 [Smallanthus sonchifolius]